MVSWRHYKLNDVGLPYQKSREECTRDGIDAKADQSSGLESDVQHEKGDKAARKHYVPDGGYGWVIVLCGLAINFLVDGVFSTFGVFLGKLEEAFQRPKSVISIANSLQIGVSAINGPIVSVLINKYGCRPVVISGSLIAGAAFIVSTFFNKVDFFVFIYGVIAGFGFGMMYLPSIIAVSLYFEKKRALATGICVCGSGIGIFVWAPVSEFLLNEYNWNWALRIIGAIILNGIVFGGLIRPLGLLPSHEKNREKSSESDIVEEIHHDLVLNNQNNLLGDTDNDIVLNTKHELFLDNKQNLDSKTEHDLVRYTEHDLVTNTKHDLVRNIENFLARNDEHDLIKKFEKGLVKKFEKGLVKDTAHKQIRNNKHDLIRYPEKELVGNSERNLVGNSETDLVRYSDNDLVGNNEPNLVRDTEHFSMSSNTNESNGEASDNFSIYSNSQKAAHLSQTRSWADYKAHQQGKVNRDRRHSEPIVTMETDSIVPRIRSQTFEVTKQKTIDSTSADMVSPALTVLNNFPNVQMNKCLESDINASNKRRSLIVPLIINLCEKELSKNNEEANVPADDKINKCLTDAACENKTSLDRAPKEFALQITRSASTCENSKHIKKSRKCDDVWDLLTGYARKSLSEMKCTFLFKDKRYWIFIAGSFSLSVGLFVPFVYVNERAISLGIDQDQAAFLLSIIGITNLFGRILTGSVITFLKINPVLMTVLAILLSGLMTIGISFCHSYGSMAAVSATFGLGFAAYNAMFTIVLCNLFGVEQLTSALGFAVFFRGTGVIIGPPVAGAVIDITGSFDKAFYVGGAFIVLGGLLHMMLLQPCSVLKANKENRCSINDQ